MKTDFDVIIIGAGGSGLAAAVSASENGCSVLLLEKRPQPGGTTGIAVGSFTANRTGMQKRAGIPDELEHHAEDAGKFAPSDIESRNNFALRNYFLSHTAETLNWLQGMGLNFHGPSPEPPNRVPRMHNVVPNAKAYIATLQARFLRLSGQMICDATVQSLITNDTRVVGVEAECDGIMHGYSASRGVVLACGDYANSHQLISEYKGDQFGQIDGINPFASGEGHRLAQSAGARLVNMDITYGPEIRFVAPEGKFSFQQLLPTSGPLAWLMGRILPLVPKCIINAMIKRLLVTWQHPENALFADGAILINQRGERFCNEKQWPDREIAIANQPDKLAYILLDKRLCERYSVWPHFISTAPKIAYAYVNDYLRLRSDVARSSSSADELAHKLSIDHELFRKSIESYNAYATGKETDRFGRSGDHETLRGNRWVMLGPARAYFTTTEGGAAIDETLRVLDEQGIPIPGLYAVGQNGLGGQILWGHGLHIAWALTSGRLVGKVLGSTAGPAYGPSGFGPGGPPE